MGKRDSGAHGLYVSYREWCNADLLPRAIKNCALIFFLLQTFIFIPADWIFFPESFYLFLPGRLFVNVLLGIAYFWGAERFPRTALVVGITSGSFLFLGMVNLTGGAESGYYAGLMLLAIGLGVLVPIPGKEGLLIGSSLFFGYLALPLYNDDPLIWETFVQNLFFLGAAVLEGAFACMYVDRLRFADFKQRDELQQARDKLAELDRAKSRFSANIHHELRTPLTLILAPLDSLRAGDFGSLSEEVAGTLQTMYANGRRLLKMINNLLDLAKVESQQFEIHRVPLDLGKLVGDLVEGAQALAKQKGVSLSIAGFEGIPKINADPDALEKVIVNLVGNALKFTERGDSVEVVGSAVAAGVRVAVVDTGVGIPKEKVDSIFDRFAQVDGSATRRHEGTGIGLSLAMEFVELHGGKIWAESEGLGHGTTLFFDLPIGSPDADTAEDVLIDDEGSVHKLGQSFAGLEADVGIDYSRSDETEALNEAGERAERRRADHEMSGEERAQSVGTGPEVVIAEDNPDMRALLTFIVGREFQVRAARNGREALEFVKEREPSIVLSDVMMPEMSGIDLCRAIKNDPSLEGLPVVLVTSKAESEMRVEGLEEGADDYVAKPFHPRELMARVRSIVAKRELQRQLAERNASLEQTMRELRQAEVRLVQAERLSAVGELAAGIAHEINNPVNFAINAARALDATVKDLLSVTDRALALKNESADAADGRLAWDPVELEELKSTISELVGIVSDGLSRTHTIVADLRDFAVPGQGVRSPVDVRKGIGSTLELLRYFLNQQNVEVEVDVPDDLPTLHGDAGGLNQVFLNLLKNAAEAMEGRGGHIRVQVRADAEQMRIRFEDDGPGMTEAVLSRLFEPFFTTKDEGQGSGLGLSISYQIAEAHGGQLEVESAIGRGSTFTLTLPVAAQGGDRAA